MTNDADKLTRALQEHDVPRKAVSGNTGWLSPAESLALRAKAHALARCLQLIMDAIDKCQVVDPTGALAKADDEGSALLDEIAEAEKDGGVFAAEVHEIFEKVREVERRVLALEARAAVSPEIVPAYSVTEFENLRSSLHARLERQEERAQAYKRAIAEAKDIVVEKISSYSGGDRPPSPPAWLLRLENALSVNAPAQAPAVLWVGARVLVPGVVVGILNEPSSGYVAVEFNEGGQGGVRSSQAAVEAKRLLFIA